jgi:hypothetical protein
LGMKECHKEGDTKKVIIVCADSQSALTRTYERAPRQGEMMAHQIRWWIHAAQQRGYRVQLE